jgi:monofunctional biosynthetic peptidoglycan transglycosylase
MARSVLFDFAAPDPDPAAAWRSVNDVVMGGVSEGSFEPAEAGAAFTGTVSLERGGGFASVRAPEASYDLSGADGLRLRLRGDGKRYWCTLYTTAGRSVSYRAPIAPPEDWTTLAVPFGDLVPYRRGTKRPDAPPFDPAQVRTLGFLIADEQAGPFRLEVARIRAASSPPDAA